MMKTSTLLLLAGAAAAGYWYARRKSGETAAIAAQAIARDAPPAQVIPPEVDVVGYVGPAWSWGPTVFVGGGGRGHGGHHGGHGGHGRGGGRH